MAHGCRNEPNAKARKREEQDRNPSQAQKPDEKAVEFYKIPFSPSGVFADLTI